MTQTTATQLAGQGEQREGGWWYLALLGLARLGASWAMAEGGLRALSDDDYARVTIAQRFAEQAKLDPSGTSWLPFPFWATGTVMKLLDPSLEVARATASALAVGATWLLFAAARMWGFDERRAFAAALGATALPVVAVLGGVTVPELPAGALSVFALVAVAAPATREAGLRLSPSLCAGAAMLVATLSRYETWPVAAVVAVFAAFGRAEPIPWKRALASGLSLAGPVWWVAHNRLAHGDAFSFLRRVSSYRAALGASSGGHENLRYLQDLAAGCPAVVVAFVGLGMVAFRRDRAALRAHLARMRPWGVASALLIVFLLAGALLGGAPTHHPERTLLVVWLLATFAVVDLTTLVRPPVWLAIVVAPLLAVDYRGVLADGGVDRRAEETIGTQLRSLVPRGERAFVATIDYGYFAVTAAFGRPWDVVIDQTHDPRISNERTLLADRWNAAERLQSEGATWLVAPSDVVFPMSLRQRTRDARLSVYELGRSR
jgi:hypothetical protein